ncbi:hypothetical protein JCM3770_003602, partial [Rhodotorula araucariae]
MAHAADAPAETTQPQLSILRIKRKRTDHPAPLDALVIEHPQPTHKRRRNNPNPAPDDPASTPRGIFRFAETVPLDSFSTPSKTRSLRDRIQSFLAHPPPALSRTASSSSLRSAFAATSASSAPAAVPGSPAASGGARRKLPSSLRAARSAAGGRPGSATPPSPLARASAPATRADAAHADRAALRYRVVERRRAETAQADEERRRRCREDDEIRRGLRPPRVLDSRLEARERDAREQEQEREREREGGMRIYEAVAEGVEKKKTRDERVEDGRMDRFGEMLDEYLSLQESITPTRPPPAAPAAAAPQEEDAREASDSDSDSDASFVYDVYYRAAPTPGPAAGPSSSSSAVTGAGTDAPGPIGWDVSSLAGLTRIGQLAGLDPDEDDAALQLLSSAAAGDASSEEEDNADQDSN